MLFLLTALFASAASVSFVEFGWVSYISLLVLPVLMLFGMTQVLLGVFKRRYLSVVYGICGSVVCAYALLSHPTKIEYAEHWWNYVRISLDWGFDQDFTGKCVNISDHSLPIIFSKSFTDCRTIIAASEGAAYCDTKNTTKLAADLGDSVSSVSLKPVYISIWACSM